jgi:hypothetical protein
MLGVRRDHGREPPAHARGGALAAHCVARAYNLLRIALHERPGNTWTLVQRYLDARASQCAASAPLTAQRSLRPSRRIGTLCCRSSLAPASEDRPPRCLALSVLCPQLIPPLVQPGSLGSKAENSPVEPDQVKRLLARALYLACFIKQASVLCARLVMRAATAFPKHKMVPAHASCLRGVRTRGQDRLANPHRFAFRFNRVQDNSCVGSSKNIAK